MAKAGAGDGPVTIKKYANRKLYHLDRKRYITLDGIAELIQAGEQVQVLDNETGEDISASILAQVALQARAANGWPPPSARSQREYSSNRARSPYRRS